MTLWNTLAHRSKARPAAVFAAVLGLAAATITALPGAAAQPAGTDRASAAATEPHPKSDKDLGEADRARIAAAEAAGKKTVTLLVAAERDRLSAAADQLRALGGVVLKSDGAVDYLKVDIPTGKAEQAARLSAVEAVDVDGFVPLDDPRPEGAEQPDPADPARREYAAHQSVPADGRHAGRPVRSGQPDVGRARYRSRSWTPASTSTYPALRPRRRASRRSSTGTTRTPRTPATRTWVSTTGRFNGAFTAGGRTWTAPATGGPYAFGLLRENGGRARGRASSAGTSTVTA